MKLTNIALAALISAGAIGGFTTANAAPYTDPEMCVADIGKLDLNGDGFVDNTEMAEYDQIKTGVDTDGDGKISNEETTVACKNGAVDALKPKSG